MKLTAGIPYEEVQEVYKKEKDVRIKQRLFIILKTFKTKSSYEVAEHAETSHTKVLRWVKRFNKKGFEGLYDKERIGSPSRLTKTQKKKLEKTIENPGEFRAGYNTIEVLDKIKKLFNINYTVRHVRRLLHQMGFSQIKPRPSHVNKDPIKAKKVVSSLKKNSRVWVKTGPFLQEMNSA